MKWVLLFVFHTCLTCLLVGPVMAQSARNEDCAFQDWLFTSLALSEAATLSSTRKEANTRFVQLRQNLFQTPPTDLTAHIKANGLDHFEADIINFYVNQWVLLAHFQSNDRDALHQYQQAPEFTFAVKKFHNVIANLPCIRSVDPINVLVSSMVEATPPEANLEPSAIRRLAPMVIAGSLVIVALICAIVLGRVLYRRAQVKRRRNKRFVCSISCAVSTQNQTFPSTIVDISQTGAKLNDVNELTPGTHVVVIVNEKLLKANVIWSNAHYTGIRFRRRLRSSKLNRILNAGNAKA